MDPGHDLHVRIAAVLLGLTGLPLAAMLVLSPLAMLQVLVLGNVPPDWGEPGVPLIFGVVLGLTFVLGVVGATQLVAARGLWRQRRLGWLLGLGLAAVWAMGGLLPLSAYLLFALLRAPVRERFAAPAHA